MLCEHRKNRSIAMSVIKWVMTGREAKKQLVAIAVFTLTHFPAGKGLMQESVGKSACLKVAIGVKDCTALQSHALLVSV